MRVKVSKKNNLPKPLVPCLLIKNKGWNKKKSIVRQDYVCLDNLFD